MWKINKIDFFCIMCRWTSKYCQNAQLLLKVDDDVLLRTNAALILAENITRWMSSKTPIYIGKFITVGLQSSPTNGENDYSELPYRVKIYAEFNFATWLRLFKFTELNVSEL